MIPILYDANESTFTSEGHGRFGDALSCRVVEQVNGEYELEMVYPVSGYLYQYLDTGMIVMAKPNETDQTQPFRIYKISVPFNGRITINAHHISYDLSGIPVGPFTAIGIQAALGYINQYAMVQNQQYTLSTDIVNTTSVMNNFPCRSFRACLGGSEGSLLDTFSGQGTGEFHFDRFNIEFLKHRGSDTGVRIEYGKNLKDISKEKTLESVYTGVVAYWNNTEAVQISNIQYVSGTHPVQKIYMLDCSSEFEETPTTAQLNTRAAKYRDDNDVGTPKMTLKVDFVPLWQTVEYKDIAPIEHISLCDTLTVYYPKYGVDVQMKAIETDYNVLLERYNSITLGNAKSNLASTIQQQIDSSIQKSNVNQAAFYIAENAAYLASTLYTNYSNVKRKAIANGLIRPFISAGVGTSVSFEPLDTSINTLLVITGHNSTSSANTLWMVRLNSGLCIQLGGGTGSISLSASSNTITVTSTGGNVGVYYMAVEGSSI